METTILNQEMKMARNPEEAWNNGLEYFRAAEEQAYQELSKEQLTKLLRSAYLLQKEDGYIHLFEDPEMPADARADIVYKPSYAIAAISMYAFQTYLNMFGEEMNCSFRKLLEGAFQYGIVGHGIEHEETVRRTMLILCKAGLRGFLTAHHKEYIRFAQTMHKHMTYFEELSERLEQNEPVVTEDIFSPDSINHQIRELVAYWNGNTHPIFVYGTLMKGQRAEHMMAGSDFGGYFQLKDYAMYNLGRYPGIVPCKGESVLGELYFVNDEMLATMDRYEEEGDLYLRAKVKIWTEKTSFAAEAYVYNRDISGCEKMREAWNAKPDDFVWYAGYGSNLSSERFSCYISGGTCAENGKNYKGAEDPTPARAVKLSNYPGALYFGNSSPSWDGSGVAFFDPNVKDLTVHMKCYLITRDQLHSVMKQEGKSADWYGRMVCLEVDKWGRPVYTLTSETRRPPNAPSPAYTALIAKALAEEFKMPQKQIEKYMKGGNSHV